MNNYKMLKASYNYSLCYHFNLALSASLEGGRINYLQKSFNDRYYKIMEITININKPLLSFGNLRSKDRFNNYFPLYPSLTNMNLNGLEYKLKIYKKGKFYEENFDYHKMIINFKMIKKIDKNPFNSLSKELTIFYYWLCM